MLRTDWPDQHSPPKRQDEAQYQQNNSHMYIIVSCPYPFQKVSESPAKKLYPYYPIPDFISIMSKPKYHLLPVEGTGRPSMDTLSNDSVHHEDDTSGFRAIHLTVFFRIIAFALFLTSAILLRIENEVVIPSSIFLSFAIAHNFYVVFRYILSRFLVLKISFLPTVNNSKKLDRVLSFLPAVVDGLLLVMLLIVLPIGHTRIRSFYWSNIDDVEGFIVAYVGL